MLVELMLKAAQRTGFLAPLVGSPRLGFRRFRGPFVLTQHRILARCQVTVGSIPNGTDADPPEIR